MEHVIVSILILGAPEKGWPEGATITNGAHDMYTPATRPLWLSNANAYNTDHCNRYNHTLEIVEMAGPDFFSFQRDRCNQFPPDTATSARRKNCYMGAHRENCTWFKLRWLLQHLLKNTAEYILFIDCDAIIKTYPKHDTVTKMIAEMNSHDGVDMLVADENWQCLEKGFSMDMCPQKGATNTGVILVRNCDWTRYFLEHLIMLQETRQCGSNEQACFRSLYGRNFNASKDHIYIASGLVWNRHPTRPKEDWLEKNATEIVHFMGAAKPALRFVDIPHIGHCGTDRLCINVDQCALQLNERPGNMKSGKYALVLTHDLHKQPSDRFHDTKTMQSIIESAAALQADAILMVPSASIASHPLTDDEQTMIKGLGFQVHFVDWIVPPRLHVSFSSGVLEMCSRHQLIRLHALGLSAYNAVAVLNKNFLVRHKSLKPALECAAQNKVLMTPVDDSTDIAGGTLVASPRVEFLDAIIHFAQNTDVNLTPSGDLFSELAVPQDGLPAGAATDCMSTVLHSFLRDQRYREAAHLSSTAAVEKSGGKAKESDLLPSLHALDRCVWHRVRGDDGVCGAGQLNVSCDSAALVHHKACEESRP
eukprot:m.215606 g.215606  ORF g.215606 m.215606 type:complete len:592 (+) comp19106_c0_seq1:308-2083(+)